MSAIGSVMVIEKTSFPAGVPVQGLQRRVAAPAPPVWSPRSWSPAPRSPGGLGHAREFTPMGKFANADPAQPELAVDRAWPSAPLASGVRPHRELRLALRLDDQRLLGHPQFSLN